MFNLFQLFQLPFHHFDLALFIEHRTRTSSLATKLRSLALDYPLGGVFVPWFVESGSRLVESPRFRPIFIANVPALCYDLRIASPLGLLQVQDVVGSLVFFVNIEQLLIFIGWIGIGCFRYPLFIGYLFRPFFKFSVLEVWMAFDENNLCKNGLCLHIALPTAQHKIY